MTIGWSRNLTWDPPTGCLDPEGYYIYDGWTLLDSVSGTLLSYMYIGNLSVFNISAYYYFGESEHVPVFCVDDVDEISNPALEIYPNPVIDWFVIRSDKEMKAIEIYDNFGQLVLQKHIAGKEATENLSGRPSGIYLLKIQTEAGEFDRKIILK